MLQPLYREYDEKRDNRDDGGPDAKVSVGYRAVAYDLKNELCDDIEDDGGNERLVSSVLALVVSTVFRDILPASARGESSWPLEASAAFSAARLHPNRAQGPQQPLSQSIHQ